jgi:CheY-like chemotaxis protein
MSVAIHRIEDVYGLDPARSGAAVVAYVDDEEFQRRNFEGQMHIKLRNAGRPVDVYIFENPKDLIAAVEMGLMRKAVIVSDNDMPEMQGAAMMAAIHALDETIPLAIISGLPQRAREDERLPKNASVYDKARGFGEVTRDFILPHVTRADTGAHAIRAAHHATVS